MEAQYVLEASRHNDHKCPGTARLHFERMRNAAWSPHQGAGAGDELVIALAESDLALEHVDAFILAVMDVQRWAEALRKAALDQAECTPGIGRAGLDPHQAALPPKCVLRVVSVGSGAAHVRFPPSAKVGID